MKAKYFKMLEILLGIIIWIVIVCVAFTIAIQIGIRMERARSLDIVTKGLTQ